ncbi:MAG: hypothetical protein JO244_14560, partial [Solirubrobacterales bacterium]|nr:hypothetical protein [Solirubrobacterales bacterium]
MSTVQPDLEAVTQQHVAAILDALSPVALAQEMAEALMASMPELDRADDADFRAGLLLSCQANLDAVWGQLRGGGSLESITPPSEAVAWARDLVHRGVELPALLRSYRLGHGLAERRLEEVAGQVEIEPEIRWRALARMSHFMFAYVDTICTALVDDYEHERARWIRGAAAARAELVTAIIERQPVDARSATDRLRYDVARRHLALIVWSDPRDGVEPGGSLEAEAVRLAAALGGGPVLTIPIGARVVWAWTSGDALSDEPAQSPLAIGDGVRAAIGTPLDGLAGMADSHEEAGVARRVAELRRVRPGTVVGYRRAGLTGLVTGDPGEAVRFAKAELGALLAPTDTCARLRATVKVYLEESLS